MEKKKKLGPVAQYGGKYFVHQSLCHMKLSKMAERNIECLKCDDICVYIYLLFFIHETRDICPTLYDETTSVIGLNL